MELGEGLFCGETSRNRNIFKREIEVRLIIILHRLEEVPRWVEDKGKLVLF